MMSTQQVTEGDSVMVCASLTGADTLEVDVVVSLATSLMGGSAEAGEGVYELNV